MKKLTILLAALAIAAMSLAACGGDDDDDGEAAATTETTQTQPAGGGGGGGGETLALEADASGALKFDTDQLSAAAGTVTIDFTNPAAISHDVVLEQDSQELGRTDLISNGDEDSFTVTLQPGEYTYYCSVPGHRESGMEGTLTAQ
jgi:plastocyanin